jgi:hypothetical protein
VPTQTNVYLRRTTVRTYFLPLAALVRGALALALTVSASFSGSLCAALCAAVVVALRVRTPLTTAAGGGCCCCCGSSSFTWTRSGVFSFSFSNTPRALFADDAVARALAAAVGVRLPWVVRCAPALASSSSAALPFPRRGRASGGSS